MDNEKQKRCDVNLRTFVLKKIFIKKFELFQQAMKMITLNHNPVEEVEDGMNNKRGLHRSQHGEKRKPEPIVLESAAKRFKKS